MNWKDEDDSPQKRIGAFQVSIGYVAYPEIPITNWEILWHNHHFLMGNLNWLAHTIYCFLLTLSLPRSER